MPTNVYWLQFHTTDSALVEGAEEQKRRTPRAERVNSVHVESVASFKSAQTGAASASARGSSDSTAKS